MRIFQILLTFIWTGVLILTIVAISKQGVAASANVFSHDLAAGNWRSQFDGDLLAHMLLLGFWAAWRQRFSAMGILAGLCCTFGVSLFSMIFIVILSVVNKADMKKILLGIHAEKYA